MALTNFRNNFANLDDGKKIVWSRQLWQDARDNMFFNKFMGSDQNSVVQRITDLTRTERGEEVVMQLVADLIEDGVVHDNEREGMEESLQNYEERVNIDLISHGVANTGKLSDQKSVIDFRSQAKDKLAYWLANRLDQLMFLTLSGYDYTHTTGGAQRSSSAFSALAFNTDVSAPTTNRHYRVTNDASGVYTGLAAGDTTSVDATDTLSYRALVDICTQAKVNYVKPLRSGGKDLYVVFCRPEALAQLKKDDEYQRAVVTGLPRSEMNPFFSGGTVTVDGLILHEHRLVFNTTEATAGASPYGKWGAGTAIDGSRALVCGAQALGVADLGNPEWAEETFQYKSRYGINVDKMFGLVKPKFHSIYSDTVEDFGVIALDHAI